MIKLLRFLNVLMITLVSDNIAAHSGGLNASGCHGGSKPYHCHRSPSEVTTSSSGNTRLRCDLGSQSYDCKKPRQNQNSNRAGRSNGLSPKPNREYELKPGFSNEILRLQILLLRHCAHLPVDLADGVLTNVTIDAVEFFQNTHGINPSSPEANTNTIRLLRSAPTGNCRLSTKNSSNAPLQTLGAAKSSNTNKIFGSTISNTESKTKSIVRKSFDKTLVRNIQSHLALRGYKPGPVDGLYGPATYESIKRYQVFKSIFPDGIPTYELLFLLTSEGN